MSPHSPVRWFTAGAVLWVVAALIGFQMGDTEAAGFSVGMAIVYALAAASFKVGP